MTGVDEAWRPPTERQRRDLEATVAELLGCDPSTISADGFTMSPVNGGAVVHATVVKLLTREQAERLGAALNVAYAPPR